MHDLSPLIIRRWLLLCVCVRTLNAGMSSLVYRDLCTANPRSVTALISRAFVRQNDFVRPALFTRSSWTHVEPLQPLCSDAGFPSPITPDLVFVSKLWPTTEDRLLVMLSARINPDRHFRDQDQQSGFSVWFQYKLTRIPFHCPQCRIHLKLVTQRLKEDANLITSSDGSRLKEERLNISYGMMTNLYPYFLDLEKFAAVLEQDKQEYVNDWLKITFSSQHDDSLTDEIGNKSSVADAAAAAASSKTSNSSTTLIHWLREPQKMLNREQRLAYIHQLNLSAFGMIDQRFLLGVRVDTNSGLGSNAVEQLQKNLNRSRFHLEYSLCYQFDEQLDLFSPLDNCVAVPFEDAIIGQNSTRFGGECICWNKSSFKAFAFIQLILGLAILLTVSLFCHQLRRKHSVQREIRQMLIVGPKSKLTTQINSNSSSSSVTSRIPVTDGSGGGGGGGGGAAAAVKIGSTTSSPPVQPNPSSTITSASPSVIRSHTSVPAVPQLIFYQLLMQFTLPLKPKAQLRFHLQFLGNNGQPILEHTFKLPNRNVFTPYIMCPDLKQINYFFSSAQPLAAVHNVVITYLQSAITPARSTMTTNQPAGGGPAAAGSGGGGGGGGRGSSSGHPRAVLRSNSGEQGAVTRSSSVGPTVPVAPSVPCYLYGLMLTCGYEKNYQFMFPYGNYLPPMLSVRLSELVMWRAYINRLLQGISPLRDQLPLQMPPVLNLSCIELYFLRVYFVSQLAKAAHDLQDVTDLHWSMAAILVLMFNLLFYFAIRTIYMSFIKPLLSMSYAFLNIERESTEIKILMFICLVFPFLQLIQTYNQLRHGIWKHPLPADKPHQYEQMMFSMDLDWLVIFLIILFAFFAFNFLIEYFIISKFAGQRPVESGPPTAIEDRLVNN